MSQKNERKEKRENNGYPDAHQKEKIMGTKTPARENKR
jgi:hypothetical protein